MAHGPSALLPPLGSVLTRKDTITLVGVDTAQCKLYKPSPTRTQIHRVVPCPLLRPAMCVHSLEDSLGKKHIWTLRVGSGPWGGVFWSPGNPPHVQKVGG